MDFISQLNGIAAYGISIAQGMRVVANSDKDAEKIIPLAKLVHHTSSILDRVANLIKGNESKYPTMLKDLEGIRDNCTRDLQILGVALQSFGQAANACHTTISVTSFLDGLGDEGKVNALFHDIETSFLLLKIYLKELEDPESTDDGSPVAAIRREEAQTVPQQPRPSPQRNPNMGTNQTIGSYGIQEHARRRSSAPESIAHDSPALATPYPGSHNIGRATVTRKVSFAENPVLREPHDDLHAIYEGYLLQAKPRSKAKSKAKSRAIYYQPYSFKLFSQDEDFLLDQLTHTTPRKRHQHDLLCRLPAPAREEVVEYLLKVNDKIPSPYRWTIIGIEEEFVRNTARWRRLLPGSQRKTKTDPPSWLVVLRGTERHPSCLPPEYPHDEMARLKLANRAQEQAQEPVPYPELYDAEDSGSEPSYQRDRVLEEPRRREYNYGRRYTRPHRRHHHREYIDEDLPLALGPLLPRMLRPRRFSSRPGYWPGYGPGLGSGLQIEAQIQTEQSQIYRDLVRDAARDRARDVLREAAWMRGQQLIQQQQQLQQRQLEVRRRILGMSGMW